MKKSLSHLPKWKKDELERIVEIVTENTDVEMIVLFGSHARGDWVEDRFVEDGVIYEYKSDFDLLLVVKRSGYARTTAPWEIVKSKVRRDKGVDTSVGLIVHDIKDLNRRIAQGDYFFTDIKKEGIKLYDSKRLKLARRRKLKPEERRKQAREDFEYWFERAQHFYDDFIGNFEKERYKQAAFNLHQATEHAYHAVLLVFDGYKPKVHDLEELGRRANERDRRFLCVFPKSTETERIRFNLLSRAYVEARYNKKYEIGKKDLEYLANQVERLHALVEKACLEKIETSSWE